MREWGKEIKFVVRIQNSYQSLASLFHTVNNKCPYSGFVNYDAN